MNKVILMGHLVAEPEVRYGGANNTAVAGFRLAVNRRFKREGQPDADFFRCTAFGRTGEFVERYLHKGTKVVLDGEIQNDNYRNKDGNMVYGMQIIVNQIEFAESKRAAEQNGGGFIPSEPAGAPAGAPNPAPAGFMNIDTDVDDDEIPFA